jgi:hypothetical protein
MGEEKRTRRKKHMQRKGLRGRDVEERTMSKKRGGKDEEKITRREGQG